MNWRVEHKKGPSVSTDMIGENEATPHAEACTEG